MSPWWERGSLTWVQGDLAQNRALGATPAAAGGWLGRRGRENCEFSGPQLGGGAERARPNHHPKHKRPKSFPPGPSLSSDPWLGQPEPHLKGLGRPLGAAAAACEASVPRAGCGLCRHLRNWSSWVGRGVYDLRSPDAGPSRGQGTPRHPGEPKPGGHCCMLMLPVGGGTAKAKPPREFPFWKLGTSFFMTFSRGGERGTGWVYGSDTICVMTSAPTKPLSSVNSWEGPGWAWNAGCRGGWGRGSLESGPGPC